ncbi:MAG: GNAT family N-acetyltransferase [Candidatus Thorarchaeota archaeon]
MDQKNSDRSSYQSFKLRRIFQKELPIKSTQTEQVNKLGHRYIIMELPIERVPVIYKMKEKDIEKLVDVIKIKPYNPDKDAETFAFVFNTILMTSPDPYRPMSIEEAKIFSSNGTFLAFLYGQPAGFAALTIENTEEGKVGVIAGIGVMPKFRGKKVALSLTKTILGWFSEMDVVKLQCEVYEFNEVSYNFISSLGFHEVGEMYLDSEISENPTSQIQ